MPVFIDRTRLSPAHLPKRLLHREKEFSLLRQILEAGVERGDDVFYSRVQVVGPVGAGKTTLCLMVGQEMQRKHRKLLHVYVNLRRFASSKVSIYRYLVRSVSEEAYSVSLSAEELLENLLNFLKNTGQRLIITFDDADYHVSMSRGRDTVVYDFTRLYEISSVRPMNVLGVVFVSRESGYGGYLDRAETSSLGASVLRLEPYTREQLIDILADRVSEAFIRGAVPDSVVEHVADVVSKPPYFGDVRLALDLLLYAGNLAENDGRDFVKVDDVRYALAETISISRAAEYADLPEKPKAVLLSIAKVLQRGDEQTAELKEVREMFSIFCESHGLSASGFDKALSYLAERGYIEKHGDKVGLVGVDARRLTTLLEQSLKR
ncbi:MAG: AAA family ATPase [Candidatus Caldarchaeum sp.]